MAAIAQAIVGEFDRWGSPEQVKGISELLGEIRRGLDRGDGVADRDGMEVEYICAVIRDDRLWSHDDRTTGMVETNVVECFGRELRRRSDRRPPPLPPKHLGCEDPASPFPPEPHDLAPPVPIKPVEYLEGRLKLFSSLGTEVHPPARAAAVEPPSRRNRTSSRALPSGSVRSPPFPISGLHSAVPRDTGASTPGMVELPGDVPAPAALRRRPTSDGNAMPIGPLDYFSAGPSVEWRTERVVRVEVDESETITGRRAFTRTPVKWNRDGTIADWREVPVPIGDSDGYPLGGKLSDRRPPIIPDNGHTWTDAERGYEPKGFWRRLPDRDVNMGGLIGFVRNLILRRKNDS